jgi:hypothetical protein
LWVDTIANPFTITDSFADTEPVTDSFAHADSVSDSVTDAQHDADVYRRDCFTIAHSYAVAYTINPHRISHVDSANDHSNQVANAHAYTDPYTHADWYRPSDHRPRN